MHRRSDWITLFVILGLLFTGSCDNEKSGQPMMVTETPITGPLLMPTGWEGSWDFTLSFVDCATDEVLARERYLGTFTEGDTLNLMLLPILGSCPGYIKGDSLIFTANESFTHGGCTVTIALEFGAKRSGDSIAGSGSWTSTVAGNCVGLNYDGGCEQIELSGLRVSSPRP